MKKCINQCENRALNLILSAYEFPSDSGASEKHFIFLNFGQLFWIFWPALRHQGWCQNIAQRSPKLFGKTYFLTLETFLEHVRNMSKKCILSYHMISYDIMIWYHIISYDIMWYDIIWYDIISHDMISYHIIWYYMTCYAKLRYTFWTCSWHVPKKFGGSKIKFFQKVSGTFGLCVGTIPGV